MNTESKTRMTEGSISRKIIFFAIPLFFGNLFQQLYNTADSLIVGNYLGSDALAAVSSSGNLIFLMVGFINGIAMGAGVVIAMYYGAKKRDHLQRAIHTTVAVWIGSGGCPDGYRNAFASQNAGADGNASGCTATIHHIFFVPTLPVLSAL